MTSYDERERDYYQVLALTEKQTLGLVERIVNALVQRRSRITMLSIVHWLPDEWQCIDDAAAIDYFHGEMAREGDEASGASGARDATQRIERLDFSAALGANERDYHRAMALLDFLDVRFYCSYITRTSGTVYVKPQRKPRTHRGLLERIGDFVQGKGTPHRVVEYRVVLDLVLTMFARRENALQLASAMRYGTPAAASETSRTKKDAVPPPPPPSPLLKPTKGRGALSGSGSAVSRSDSVNVRSTASAHSGERSSLSHITSERSRSPNISAAVVPDKPTSAASSSTSSFNASSASSSSSSSSSSSPMEIIEPRQRTSPRRSYDKSSRPPSSAILVRSNSSSGGGKVSAPARRVVIRQPGVQHRQAQTPILSSEPMVKQPST